MGLIKSLSPGSVRRGWRALKRMTLSQICHTSFTFSYKSIVFFFRISFRVLKYACAFRCYESTSTCFVLYHKAQCR